MSKKKKKKAMSFKSMTKNIVEILREGKVKLNGEKYKLCDSIVESINGTRAGHLNDIISAEKVGPVDNSLFSQAFLLKEMTVACQFKETFETHGATTIVVPVRMKDACDFDYLDENTAVGDLLRTSTLPSIYKRIKTSWVDICDKEDQHTNILHIPNIMVFINNKTGLKLKRPFYVDLLIVAVPEVKIESDDMVLESEEKVEAVANATSLAIGAIVNAAIVTGCKNIIINPYPKKFKALSKNKTEAAKLWKEISETERFKKNISTISYCFPFDDADFITFNTQYLL